MNLHEMLLHTSGRNKEGFIKDGFDASVEHPTAKRKQFEDEVLWRLRDFEWKVRMQYLISLALAAAFAIDVVVRLLS